MEEAAAAAQAVGVQAAAVEAAALEVLAEEVPAAAAPVADGDRIPYIILYIFDRSASLSSLNNLPF